MARMPLVSLCVWSTLAACAADAPAFQLRGAAAGAAEALPTAAGAGPQPDQPPRHTHCRCPLAGGCICAHDSDAAHSPSEADKQSEKALLNHTSQVLGYWQAQGPAKDEKVECSCVFGGQCACMPAVAEGPSEGEEAEVAEAMIKHAAQMSLWWVAGGGSYHPFVPPPPPVPVLPPLYPPPPPVGCGGVLYGGCGCGYRGCQCGAVGGAGCLR